MILWLLAACRTPTCTMHEECGFGEMCEAGACVGRSCASSTQCAMEEHCDDDGRCVPGCEIDTDCLAGSSCEAGSCVEDACVETRTDCGYREQCVDGACVDAGAPHCSPCSTDDQCGAGNLCWIDEWCAVDCSDGSACPAGFECLAVDDPEDGPRQVCISSCWMHVEG